VPLACPEKGTTLFPPTSRWVLEYILSFIQVYGYQPNQQQLADRFGVTKTAIAQRLPGLHNRGLIQLPDGNRERCIKVRYVRFTVSVLPVTFS